jgi:hypothetical protein
MELQLNGKLIRLQANIEPLASFQRRPDKRWTEFSLLVVFQNWEFMKILCFSEMSKFIRVDSPLPKGSTVRQAHEWAQPEKLSKRTSWWAYNIAI